LRQTGAVTELSWVDSRYRRVQYIRETQDANWGKAAHHRHAADARHTHEAQAVGYEELFLNRDGRTRDDIGNVELIEQIRFAVA
jgi:hypothetical protein